METFNVGLMMIKFECICARSQDISRSIKDYRHFYAIELLKILLFSLSNED
jgi:hypothetical protein